MINKKSLLFIFCFALTGCTMDCVEPGLQSRSASVNVEIPLHKENAETKIHWVNSGQVINKGEKIKLNVHGSINFCPSKKNTKKVLVPAGFCADGSKPNYKEAENISTVPDNYGLNGTDVCGNLGFGSDRLYVDTEIKVNPGDKLSFDLVPRKIKIDCDNLRGKITFDDSDDRSGSIKVSEKEICKGGVFKDSNGVEKKIDSSHNKEYGVLIGNGYTPYDNKVHFNIGNGDPWITGALLDFRRKKEGLNELCDGQSQDAQGRKKCTPEDLKVKKYGPYERNCYFQNICYSEHGIRSDSGKSCISSVRYEEYDDNNGHCDMYSYLKHVGSGENPVLKRNLAIAEGLIGKISSPYTDSSVDILYNATGTQCLPKDKGAKDNSVCSEIKDDFTDFSLELNNDYTINSEIIPGSNVMLGIVHNDAFAGLKRGGYHVQVTRSCEYTSGEKLYVYLGKKPPEDHQLISESDNFKSVLNLTKITEDNVDYYIIDGSHLSDGKSEEIYFGINVSNIKEDELKDEKGEYYKNNKYNLTLFVKKKINTFISSTINKVLGFVIGDKSENSVKDTYEAYRRGLSQAVRALLTLYIIFTVVGYMLGTVQLNKFDFIVRIVKIAFVTFAFSERSWEFGIMLSKFFVDGSSSLVDTFSGYIGEEGGGKFAFLDLTAGVLFTGETWLKFLSLMLAGPFGFIAFLMILKASFTFIKCIISATFKYVISSLMVAFLLSLTPLFITFILFQQTKPLFDGWIKTIAHVGIQPVILFSSLSLLNQLMYLILYNLTNFSACYQCLINVKFLSYDLCLFRSILPLGYSASTGVDVALSSGERVGGHFAALPIDLVQAFIYLLLASAMEAFTTASEAMAQSIFGPSFGVVGNIGAVAHNASQSLLSTVGLDDNTQHMIQSIKQKMGKDRAKVEVKSNGPDPSKKSDDPLKSGSQESSKKSSGGDKSKTQGQKRGRAESGDETISATSSGTIETDSETMEDNTRSSESPRQRGNSDDES